MEPAKTSSQIREGVFVLCSFFVIMNLRRISSESKAHRMRRCLILSRSRNKRDGVRLLCSPPRIRNFLQTCERFFVLGDKKRRSNIFLDHAIIFSIIFSIFISLFIFLIFNFQFLIPAYRQAGSNNFLIIQFLKLDASVVFKIVTHFPARRINIHNTAFRLSGNSFPFSCRRKLRNCAGGLS